MAWDLATTIRDKIRSGALPLPPDRLGRCWVGTGTARPCDGCDTTITEDQMEYELDLADTRTLRFHDKCFTAWRAARAERLHE